MSTLGQAGSSHNHPGHSFTQMNGLRRGYPHSTTPPNRPSPNQSPYQTQQQQQQYPPQQPPQGPYPHHLFSSTSSPVTNVASLQNVSNSTPKHPPSQATVAQHAHAAAQAARQQQHHQQQQQNHHHQQQQQQHAQNHHYQSHQHQPQPQPQHQHHQQQLPPQQQQPPPPAPSSSHPRAGQRQMQQTQAPSVAFLQQAMNSSGAQQVPQPVSQPIPPVQQVQPLPQSQAISQAQNLAQTQAMPHQVQQQPVHQVQQPAASKVQPNDHNLMSHTPPLSHTPRPQSHQQAHAQAQVQAQNKHQQTHPQAHPQLQPQAPPPMPPQATPQSQHRSTPARSEASAPPPGPPASDEMEVESNPDSLGDDSHLEPKLVDGQPFVPRAPMGRQMSAPPEGGTFDSLDQIHKYVLQYCTSVGYAVVIGRSKKTVPGLKKVLFVCDRAGKPPSKISPEMRKRKTSSRKCNCQFGFFAIEQRTQWTIRYRPDQQHLEHNHGPSESPLLHPAARKLDSKMVAAVKQLKERGIGVTQTLEMLTAQYPHVPLLPRDIYNARAAINRNPQKVETGIAESRPAIYSKPAPTAEERIRSDLRKELQRANDDLQKLKEDSEKEIKALKDQLVEKDQMIKKFEDFIDICNQRVIVNMGRLNNDGEPAAGRGNRPA